MADQDLDAILKGLSGGVAPSTTGGGGVATGLDSDLDNILQGLSNTTISPTPQALAQAAPRPSGPPCNKCQQPIPAGALNALGKLYHPSCFACAQCQTPFMGAAFLPAEGNAYCESCYNELFAVRCHACHQPIAGKCISAFGNKFHSECFKCSMCDLALAGKSYFEKEGSPICKDCKIKLEEEAHKGQTLHMCGKCGLPIYGEYLMLGGKRIHPEHFSCTLCGCKLRGGGSYELDGELYCEKDYNKLLNTTCGGCKQLIEGRAVSAIGRQWHPECFVCNICEQAFDGGKYFEKEGKAYCATHYYQRFGQVCAKCEKPVTAKAISALGRPWHEECLECVGCNKKLAGQQFRDWDLKPLCNKCFGKLPSDVRKKAEKEADKRKKEEKERIKQEQKQRDGHAKSGKMF